MTRVSLDCLQMLFLTEGTSKQAVNDKLLYGARKVWHVGPATEQFLLMVHDRPKKVVFSKFFCTSAVLDIYNNG